MIVADRKPLDEILDSIKDYKKIILMGCGGCVTICFSVGAKAVELLASQIKMARKKQGKEIEIIECAPERQCEYEFIDELKKELGTVEAVLSIACGVGVQAMTERHPESITIPGLNTKFMGYPVEHAVWDERCAGCGDCVLEWTGGVCPISRCIPAGLIVYKLNLSGTHFFYGIYHYNSCSYTTHGYVHFLHFIV